MSDSRFFSNSGEVSLSEIAALTSATIAASDIASSGTKKFSNVSPLETAGSSDISFLDNTKYLPAFKTSKAGACFVRGNRIDRPRIAVSDPEKIRQVFKYTRSGYRLLRRLRIGDHFGEQSYL